MPSLRKLAAVIAACGALTFGAATAEAAPAHDAQTAVATHTAPAAPAGAKTARPAATSPYTSPGSSAGHVAAGASYTCEYGNLCSLAWDPTVGQWELFKMYYCNRYYLYYWNGGGAYLNNQTPGSVGHFYDVNGGNLKTIYRDTTQRSYNWDPVYSIRNCGG
ncbi:hypothetical protein [Streptomyces sediminimaris]|uniref:hypothetical protein n=1 Tax=Streptomyces sediminimaris TaxID=3383721 RepID=UPI00399B2B84